MVSVITFAKCLFEVSVPLNIELALNPLQGTLLDTDSFLKMGPISPLTPFHIHNQIS